MPFALRCCKGPVGVLAALLFWACHEAPRDNPFDPVLTPAVALTVALDDTAGTATLTWTPYEGQQPFREYWVLRKVSGIERVDTLAFLGQVDQTSWVDTAMAQHTSYIYRVSVVNTSGLEASTTPWEIRPMQLPAMVLERADFDSHTATAHLKWTPYRGGQFAKYEVRRRTAELAFQVVFETQDRNVTTLVDSNLVGATEYFYQVVVETQRGEEILSEEQSGIFHQLLATWPLEVEEGEYVRLYWEGDHLAALVAGRQRVRLFLFDAQGALLEEQGLLDRPSQNIEPRSVATYLSPEGRRYVSAAFAGTVAVLGFGADGQPRYWEHPVFADSLSALISGPYATVRGSVSINSNLSFFFDQVEVSAGGQVLFEEDFEGEPEDWDVIDKYGMVAGRYSKAYATKSDEAWRDFYVEAEVLFEQQGAGNIAIGTSEEVNTSLFRLYLRPVTQQVQLSWTFNPDPTSSLSRQVRFFTEPFSLVSGPPYRMGLGFREGQFSASVSSPVVWSGTREGDAPWASLAGVGQSLLLMHGPQPRALSPEGEETLWPVLEEQASETRSWKWEGGLENWLGFCLPARNQVLFKRILVRPSGEVSRPSSLFRALGAGVGQGAGELIFPLSFDGSQDGRIYVLDAGNARLQVFDAEGKYLTQWGRKGSDEGEFDFGSGSVPEDFAGSVAVDSEGYIYVADVGNRRIQKFAP